ncbi:MAG: hypothetical protein DDG60_00360, partial [Anaerolineae bacterium]
VLQLYSGVGHSQFVIRQFVYNSGTMKFSRLLLCLWMLPALACRPVLAVGWGEFFILVALFVLLFGLPLWRWWKKF